MLHGFQLLMPRVPLRVGEVKRQIWVTPEVHDLLKGQKAGAGFPHRDADLFIGRYVRGNIVSASRRHRSKAEFKWLTGHDQVWVLSFRQPRPGWRILGRFVRKNVFVAMAYYERETLGGPVSYHAHAQAIIKTWDELFPGIAPHDGTDFEDFLGLMHRDDDE